MTQKRFTKNEFAEIFGIDRRRIGEKLEAAGIKKPTISRKGNESAYNLKDMVHAVFLGNDQKEYDLNKEKTLHTREMTRKLELENNEREGRLLDAIQIRDGLVKHIITAQAILKAMSKRISPMAAKETNENVISQKIDIETDLACNELADFKINK